MIILIGTLEDAARLAMEAFAFSPISTDLPYVWPWTYPKIERCPVSPRLVLAKRDISVVGESFDVYTVIKCYGCVTMSNCTFMNGGKIEAEKSYITNCFVNNGLNFSLEMIT